MPVMASWKSPCGAGGPQRLTAMLNSTVRQGWRAVRSQQHTEIWILSWASTSSEKESRWTQGSLRPCAPHKISFWSDLGNHRVCSSRSRVWNQGVGPARKSAWTCASCDTGTAAHRSLQTWPVLSPNCTVNH